MATNTIKLDLTEEFKRLLEQAKDDFRQVHTELTDDLRKLIAEEVEKQLKAVGHQLQARQPYHKPTLEAK